MKKVVRHPRQQGAVIVTVCLMLLFLLGFMGIAIDFGRAFVVKTELQTAMDSCALAAAQELDTAEDAITRASSAGLTAGNQNRVQFQSTDWGGQGMLTSADITFLDAYYGPTSVGADARYVRCEHTQPNVAMLLMSALGFFFNDDTHYPATRNVGAFAVAKRAGAQTGCPLPIALVPKQNPGGGNASGPDFGYTKGEWVPLLLDGASLQPGHIGWANLNGSNNANDSKNQLNGQCAVAFDQPLSTPGVQASIAEPWNYRFGIYKNSGDPMVTYMRPDFTGYVYTKANWPSQSNAFDGPAPGTGTDPAGADSFVNKRLAFAPCGTSVNNCENITQLSLNSFQKLATPQELQQHGANRRLGVVPVINPANKHLMNFVCMLILQPISIPMKSTDSVQLEYVGPASDPLSPCTTNGLPGGMGPQVPVLVR